MRGGGAGDKNDTTPKRGGQKQEPISVKWSRKEPFQPRLASTLFCDKNAANAQEEGRRATPIYVRKDERAPTPHLSP